ncbi:MAG: replication-associated recombination protein A [Deltaproteobacteria bacterium]|nr:replication-associated recombination protein A [Deltaproteobacteria bacterium]
MELFESSPPMTREGPRPLAERMRPKNLAEFAGQQHLLGPGRLLREMIDAGKLHSLILWGPPGSGKTTLAQLLADAAEAHCVRFSAVSSGVKELKKIIDEAQRLHRLGKPTVLFVDEIHHFNKAQQDTFLPHVEKGTLLLIGATTENPSFELIAPLLSRCQVLVLHPLSPEEIGMIIDRALRDSDQGVGSWGLAWASEAREFLIQQSQGDARVALNALETAATLIRSEMGAKEITRSAVEEALQKKALLYDKSGEEHYNVISAFIKSLRGSDPDAALYWLMRMLKAGEDPLFVARRMVIFAAEDIGNADPQALQVAVAAKDAVHFVGLPEGRIPLAQATTYLATAPKSNASYKAMLEADRDVDEHGALPVPLHLRNAPTELMEKLGYGKGYRYAHNFPDHIVDQEHLPPELKGRRYYSPSDSGYEKTIKERIKGWEEKKKR